MRVVWTRPAREQLAEILAYLAERNTGAAARVVAGIDARMVQLERHPQIGRPGRVGGTRELVLPGLPYVFAYRISDKVEILALMHGARRWPENFEHD